MKKGDIFIYKRSQQHFIFTEVDGWSELLCGIDFPADIIPGWESVATGRYGKSRNYQAPEFKIIGNLFASKYQEEALRAFKSQNIDAILFVLGCIEEENLTLSEPILIK